tara:strand:- start:417 stop:1049 length:633 start_codon:yes stop_codon:yes gene_type:complete
MFFSERAVLLYSEFIVMSRNPILNNDFNFTPSVNDALQFVYKKTIGPIKPNVNDCSNPEKNMLKCIFTDIRLFILYGRKYIIKYNLISKYKELLDDSVQYIAPQLLTVYRIDTDTNKLNKTISEVMATVFFDEQYFIQSCYLFKSFLDIFEELYQATLSDIDKTITTLKKSYHLLFTSENFKLQINEDIFKNKKKTPLIKNIKKLIIDSI